MIIEAGYDFWELLLPRLESEPKETPGLWMITMTDELRLISTRRISDRTSGVIVDHIDEIIQELAPDVLTVGYFVLAHRLPRVGDGIAQHVHEGDQAFLQRSGVGEKTFLGRLVFDGQFLYESCPRHRFRDYPVDDFLPRAAVVKGPHPFDCVCFVCAQHREQLARAWARNKGRGGTVAE